MRIQTYSALIFFLLPCVFTTGQDVPQPKVLATYEFHQLTNFKPHGVNFLNDTYPHNNYRQIVFNRPNPTSQQPRACDVMVMGLDGADPEVVDHWDKAWAVRVDIGSDGPVHVLSTDGWRLRSVIIGPKNKPTGPATELLAIAAPDIGKIRHAANSNFVIRRDVGRTDKPGSLGAGIYVGVQPQKRIGKERVAKDISIGLHEIISFDGFDIGAVWVAPPNGPRVVFTVNVDARPSKQPQKSGTWFYSLEGTGEGAKLRRVQSGPGEYNGVRVSGNGKKIFYRQGQKIWMVDWEGDRKKSLVADGLGYHDPQPNGDGSRILVGGTLVYTDEPVRQNLFATALTKECFAFHMDNSWWRISMINRRDGFPAQVGSMQINTQPDKILAETPRILEYTVQPKGIVSDNPGRASILRAKLRPADRVSLASWVLLAGDTVDSRYGLADQERKDAGFVAGDGVFDGFLSSEKKLPDKTRVLRIHAEAMDDADVLHGYAIEVGPYLVGPLPETPAAAQPITVAPPAAPAEPGLGQPTGVAAAGTSGTGGITGSGGTQGAGAGFSAGGGPGTAPGTTAGGTGGSTVPGSTTGGTGTGTTGAGVNSGGGTGAGREPSIGMRLEAENRNVTEGELVYVPVWLKNSLNVANINFEIRYDPSVARPEGDVVKGNMLGSAIFSPNSRESGRIRVGFAQTDGLNGSGTVAQLPMRAVGRAGSRTPLTVMVTTIEDPNGNELAIERIDGSILILGPGGKVPGDCDGDTKITAADAMCALKMSVGNMELSLNSDANNDGKVTSGDARVLLRMAVGLTN